MLTPKQLDDAFVLFRLYPDEEELWKTLTVILDDLRDFGIQQATDPATAEDKRTIWCGQVRGLIDFELTLREIKNGTYKNWPEYRRQSGAEEENELTRL